MVASFVSVGTQPRNIVRTVAIVISLAANVVHLRRTGMTPEKLMIDALKGIVPYPMLRRAVKVSVDAIRTAQAEQRRKDAALICRWCRDKAPTLTLTEGSQGHSRGVLVHLEQERILGACPAQAILAQEE